MIAKNKLSAPNIRGQFNYQAGQGLFGVYRPTSEKRKTICISDVYQCRESFGRHWTYNDGWVVFHYSRWISFRRVNEFWQKIHAKLGLPELVIFKTHTPNRIVIQVPKFWRENRMRQGLFTLLLRCSIVYYKGNLNTAFRNYRLLSSVRNTVNFFLAGNIYAHNDRLCENGFCREFQYHTRRQLAEKLFTAPKGKAAEVKKVVDKPSRSPYYRAAVYQPFRSSNYGSYLGS